MLTGLRKSLFKYLVKTTIKQGHAHFRATQEMYQIIRDAWEAEFTEDNIPTTNIVLAELFNLTQK
jgi:DNA-binding transcriptional regulator GbsR (MarR family)